MWYTLPSIQMLYIVCTKGVGLPNHYRMQNTGAGRDDLCRCRMDSAPNCHFPVMHLPALLSAVLSKYKYEMMYFAEY